MTARCWQRRLAPALVLSLAVPSSAWASDQEAPPPAEPPRRFNRSSLHLGLLFGSLAQESVKVGGRRVDEPAGYFNGGIGLGYDQPLVDWLSMGLEWRFTSWDSEWSSHMSGRAGWDLCLVPKLHFTKMLGRTSPDLYLATGAGFTRATQAHGPGRAVLEKWSSGTGANLGAALGVAFWGSHFGGYIELGYYMRSMAFDVTSTPVAAPADEVKERVEYVVGQVLFTGGGSFAF